MVAYTAPLPLCLFALGGGLVDVRASAALAQSISRLPPRSQNLVPLRFLLLPNSCASFPRYICALFLSSSSSPTTLSTLHRTRPHPTRQCLQKVKWSHRNGTACIIISPTRELSLQTYGVLRDVIEAGNMKQSHGLLIGGANRRGVFLVRVWIQQGSRVRLRCRRLGLFRVAWSASDACGKYDIRPSPPPSHRPLQHTFSSVVPGSGYVSVDSLNDVFFLFLSSGPAISRNPVIAPLSNPRTRVHARVLQEVSS